MVCLHPSRGSFSVQCVVLNRAFIHVYLFKNFVSIVMNVSISSHRKPLITHNWKYFLGRNNNYNSKLF